MSAEAVYGCSTVKRRRRTKAELEAVDEAIVVAVAEDSPVSLRGVYYRVVSAGAVDKTEAGYRLVGRELLKLRRNGTIPYANITDGTRWVVRPDSWSDVDQMLEDAAQSYRRDFWHGQKVDVHIFTEKDAISGVILPVTERWNVPVGIVRGYVSESFAFSMAETVKASRKRHIFLYQLGDHDPSGVDAWRDFREKVVGFLGERVTPDLAAAAAMHSISLKAGTPLGVDECDPYDVVDDLGLDLDLPDDAIAYHFLGGRHFHDGDLRSVTFARLAVTEQQIVDWNLPSRPTKASDTRAKNFVGQSTEVDAIPARRLRQLLEEAILGLIDIDAWDRMQAVEQLERETLVDFRSAWRRRGS